MPLRSLLLLLILLFPLGAPAQVMQSLDLAHSVDRANALLAGATQSDVANHIHYDLKLHDMKGNVTTGTYDIYHDPMIYSRSDIVIGSYHATVIEGFLQHQLWTQTTGERPLGLIDFQENYLAPLAAIDRLMQYHPPPLLNRQEVNGAPLLCANDEATTNLCFDPLIHVYAFAQMFNQTVIYADWQTVGTHTMAGTIRLWDGKHLLVEANGKVEAVRKFPPLLFVPPPGPETVPEDERYHVIRYGRVYKVDRYGNALVRVNVDQNGKVKKAVIVDADDKHLEHIALQFAKGTVYQPYLVSGKPTPFETVLFFHNFPQEEGLD